jgi:cephalosporin-C deacetylase-like acetyl esterase
LGEHGATARGATGAGARGALRRRLRARFEIGQHPLHRLGDEAEAPGLVRLSFEDGQGRPVRGWLMLPAGPGPHPLVLVVHAHGNRYELGAQELLAVALP